MSNIAARNFKFEALSKNKQSKHHKNKHTQSSKSKINNIPLPEWNNNINNLDKYKLSSSEIVI